MSSNRTAGKLEEAAKEIAAALTFQVTRTVNAGVDDDSYQLPNVICSAEVGEEYPLTSGNFWIVLRVTVNSHIADNYLNDHKEDYQIVADKFFEDDIAAQLSNTSVEEFAVQHIRGRAQGRTIKEQARSDYIELDLNACSTDIT